MLTGILPRQNSGRLNIIMIKEEQTLIVVKPDGVNRGLVGEIIARFEKARFKIIALKMVEVEKTLVQKHYNHDDAWMEKVGERTREFYEKHGEDEGEKIGKMTNKEIGKMIEDWSCDYMTDGRVVAVVLQGHNAIQTVRKMVGATYPSEALPGTVRGDYSNESPLSANINKRCAHNIIHASGNPEEAKFEIDLWFKNEEICQK